MPSRNGLAVPRLSAADLFNDLEIGLQRFKPTHVNPLE